jgi:hypothetical protein
MSEMTFISKLAVFVRFIVSTPFGFVFLVNLIRHLLLMNKVHWKSHSRRKDGDLVLLVVLYAILRVLVRVRVLFHFSVWK